MDIKKIAPPKKGNNFIHIASKIFKGARFAHRRQQNIAEQKI
jgi:hypothetical protein